MLIGDFARLAQVSVRMLRHYDEIGLLKPDNVDSHSSTVPARLSNCLFSTGSWHSRTPDPAWIR